MLTKLSKMIMPAMALVFVFNIAIAPVQAVDSRDQFGINYAANTGLGVKDPRDTISSLIRIVMGFLGTLAVLLVLYGGFKWMMAQGNQDQVDEAKKLLVAGVIGLIIILSAWGVASFVLRELMSATVDN